MTDRWNDEFEGVLRAHLPTLPKGALLAPDASLTDLGLDSLGSIQLLVELEELFGMTFPDEALSAETFQPAETL